jgi:uncharacterized membrane protein YqaE (UPF0057 family)
MAVTCGDIPRLICSVIIPPVGVFFQVGCTKDLGINILLTLLGCVSPALVAGRQQLLTRLVVSAQLLPGPHPRRLHPGQGVKRALQQLLSARLAETAAREWR